MKSITKNIKLLALAIISLAMYSCKKDELKPFSGAPAINFVSKTATYSFLGNLDNEYIYNIDVNISGLASENDRAFSAEVVTDENTTATSAEFEILGGIVPANSYKGTLKVKVKNSPALDTKVVQVKLKLSKGEDFVGGNAESNTFILGWTNEVVVPSYKTLYQGYFVTPLSKNAYKIIVATTGLTTLSTADRTALGGVDAVVALATVFGDYVKQWNLDHPNDLLRHDDGTLIDPLNFSKNKYN